MIIMALDHVRDFFHKTVVESGASDATGPTDLATTTPILFFTRWVTHFCAPIFVFLAGASAFLMSQKKTKGDLSGFLIKRGAWLIFIEVVIITFGWTFNPLFNVVILQVIWAIGISMIILGLLCRLPLAVLFFIGFVIVFGHNLLDYPGINHAMKGGLIPDLVYFGQFSAYPFAGNDHVIMIIYSFLPWTGVMLLGFCFGRLYASNFDPQRRKRLLFGLGAGLWTLFLLLRFINKYGDPIPWSQQPRGNIFTFLSFINVNKYPPSLDFLCVTIGGGMFLLLVLENIKNRLTDFFRIYGRVPMFYYILHFYLIHILVVIFFFAQGFSSDRIITASSPFLFRPPEFGLPLWGVYLVWAFVFLSLYPICRWYDHYKSAHIREKWWLSYL
jgi:uncharacterized membrane protein